MTDTTIELDISQLRRLRQASRQTTDSGMVRRALSIIEYNRCDCVAETARRLQAARSSVYRWIYRFRKMGIDGLRTRKRGPKPSTVTVELKEHLENVIDQSPRDFGYLTNRWTSRLLARVLARHFDEEVHPSTIRRLLVRMDYRWKRARPTLHKKDPDKESKLEDIEIAIQQCSRSTATVFVDEVAIELNPRVGFAWMPKGAQKAIETPGQNQKRYVAGALHADTGTITTARSDSHDTELLIDCLDRVRLRYRGFSQIHVIMDNAPSHHSNKTNRWLANHPRLNVLYQPTYHPWVNRIERLWKQLHETVTQHHQFDTMDELMNAVDRFIEAAEPFPGNDHRMAKAA